VTRSPNCDGKLDPGRSDFGGANPEISASYSPPPLGFISPVTWGIETNVIERFGDAGVAKARYRLPGTPIAFNCPATDHAA